MMLTELADWHRDAGLRVEEIAGWRERGHGEVGPASGLVDLSHHTAGGPNGRAPSLSTCLYGVPGVPGPLCNVLQTREPDGNDVFLILAAGRSYNAGTGGYAGVSGNVNTVGTECEHDGVTPFPEHRAELRQRAAAAILKGLGHTNGARSCQHYEWSDSGKIDIGTPKVDADEWRRRITQFMQGGAPAPAPIKKGSNMILVSVKGDGHWVKNGQFWIVDAPEYARQVGQGQTLKQVLDDWGFLPSGSLPAAMVDEWVTSAIASTVRLKKLDKQLANVTLP